jgi:hypothetical protein
MVGGGKDAFIGGVHRIAARLDGRFELVAGALSSTPEKARASGARSACADRIYDDFSQMAKREARLKDGHRGGRHRHARTTCIIRRRSRVPEARHSRDLRQAADLDAGRCEEAGKGGGSLRRPVRS